jgi:hypothetical protein
MRRIDFQIALVVLGYSDIRQRFPLDSGALLHCTSAVSKVARWVLAQRGKEAIASLCVLRIVPLAQCGWVACSKERHQGSLLAIGMRCQSEFAVPLYARL